MKKILATLSAVALLLASLACGIVIASAGETDYTTAAYLDFSNAEAQAAAEAAADLSGTPGKTFTADAVYSRSSGGGATGPMLDIKFKQNIPMSIGSVLAFKVKLDYGDKYKQHLYYPQRHLGECTRNPYEYGYCTCVFGVQEGEITLEDVEKLHQETGVRIWAGTYAKDEESVNLAIEMGAELITCDNPDEVLEILRRKGLHK